MRTDRGSSHLCGRGGGGSDSRPHKSWHLLQTRPPQTRYPPPQTRQPPQTRRSSFRPDTPQTPCEETDACENITYPASLRYAVGKKWQAFIYLMYEFHRVKEACHWLQSEFPCIHILSRVL